MTDRTTFFRFHAGRGLSTLVLAVTLLVSASSALAQYRCDSRYQSRVYYKSTGYTSYGYGGYSPWSSYGSCYTPSGVTVRIDLGSGWGYSSYSHSSPWYGYGSGYGYKSYCPPVTTYQRYSTPTWGWGSSGWDDCSRDSRYSYGHRNDQPRREIRLHPDNFDPDRAVYQNRRWVGNEPQRVSTRSDHWGATSRSHRDSRYYNGQPNRIMIPRSSGSHLGTDGLGWDRGLRSTEEPYIRVNRKTRKHRDW